MCVCLCVCACVRMCGVQVCVLWCGVQVCVLWCGVQVCVLWCGVQVCVWYICMCMCVLCECVWAYHVYVCGHMYACCALIIPECSKNEFVHYSLIILAGRKGKSNMGKLFEVHAKHTSLVSANVSIYPVLSPG